MKIESVRIENFRGFRDETINLDNYACLVGPNGAGKSTVLTALNVFFRQYKDSKTDLSKLSADDFHHKNVNDPIRITVTFGELTPEAKSDLADYVRQDKLIVSAVAKYDVGSERAEVRQFGNRLGMEDFREYFEADTHGTREKSATKKLLHSDVTGQGLGTLIPDAILHSGSIIRGVVDAKYKTLHPSASSPNGPQRDDLYQMAAYLGRFQAPAGMMTWGILAYPRDPTKSEVPPAEQASPWRLDAGRAVIFATLPHAESEAVARFRELLNLVTTAGRPAQLASA